MRDIVERLRTWTHAVDAVPASDLLDEAAGEIERLREAIRRIADQDATLSVVSGNVIVEMDAKCPHVVGTTTQYCSLTQFTITDEERKALAIGIGILSDAGWGTTTLRSMLKRLGGAQ